MLVRSIFTIMNVKVSQRINGFLYFLKSIPGIKKLLVKVNYSLLGFKKFLSIISILYSLIAGPVVFALLFFLAIYLPSATFLKGDMLSNIVFFIVVFFYLYKIFGSELMEPSQEKFILVKQMKMNPRSFALSQIISGKTIDLFSKGLVLSLVFKFILGQEALAGLQIAIGITMSSIFLEAFHLYIYKHTGFIINKLDKFRFAIIFLGLIGTYVIVIFTRIPEILNLYRVLTFPLTSIIFIALGIIGLIYLYKYDRYWDVLNEENKLDTFMEIRGNVKDINFNEVKLKDKDFEGEELRENDGIEKEGYDYLNHIFFKRHKRVVYKPMLRKSWIIIVIFIAISVVNIFFVDDLGKNLAYVAIDSYSTLIFLLYMLCNSTRIIKSLFYNCDRSLLRYGFYKRGDALLKMFFLRLKKILFANMIPTIILCLGLVQLIYSYNPDRIVEAVPLVLSTLALGIFFSVHYLFIYYILQPFTTDLKTKSPLYNIINALVYFISYLFINAEISAIKLLPYIIVMVILYISMAIILVYKKAPKTFRVK